jgi:hypothetical protein
MANTKASRKMCYFFLQDLKLKMMKHIEDPILSRIYGKGRGWAFSQADFADEFSFLVHHALLPTYTFKQSRSLPVC